MGRPEIVVKICARSADFFNVGSSVSRSHRCFSVSATVFIPKHYSERVATARSPISDRPRRPIRSETNWTPRPGAWPVERPASPSVSFFLLTAAFDAGGIGQSTPQPTRVDRRITALNSAVWPGDFNGDGITDLVATAPFC